MAWSEMVVAIILIVTVGKVIQARYGVQRVRGRYTPAEPDAVQVAENARLRDEIRQLKDRMQVLERVITDNETSLRLDHEIEKLRDKNRI